MSTTLARIAAALLVANWSSDPAQATTMFKCDGPSGRPVYQDKPCDGAASTKIVVQPANQAIQAAPKTDWKLEEKLLAERERKRIRELDAANEKHAREHQRALDRCRDLAEEREREQVWEKNAISRVVRESSTVKISQIDGRRRDMGCP